MLLLILADAAFVAALMFSYFYLRGLNTDTAWLAHGQATASIAVSWLLAVGVVSARSCSAAAEQRSGRPRRPVSWVGGRLALLVVASTPR